MTAHFEARGVSKVFHAGTAAEVRALEGVCVEVDRGGFLLLAGPSGSGKTTLLALLGTLERPTAGSVLVDGRDPAALGEGAVSLLRRRLGFVFPGGPMVPRLPLWENLTLGLVATGASVAARRALAEWMLGRVGLAGRLRAPAEELSTGELQRATLARALAGRPEALLLDEPLANLDAGARALVVEAVTAFHRSGGTVVASCHDGAAFPTATGTLRLEGGRRVG